MQIGYVYCLSFHFARTAESFSNVSIHGIHSANNIVSAGVRWLSHQLTWLAYLDILVTSVDGSFDVRVTSGLEQVRNILKVRFLLH